ncbi:Protein dopey [Pseudocercospora fuligena]|uniref:Protein dopey n=1 Tax=Pseudocercospora fuligena TaxID=685502 RepID=A0A8H6RHB0_9PEZI|nr:Protein dopey [Pseudocercospora fuligena]
MSLKAAIGRSSMSPPSSGRSSPVPHRQLRVAAENDLFKADKGLRRYASNIDRALATWEISPEEWADYIAFLARLLKAIQTHPKNVPVLPHSSAIATRLAQCLNPALPAGVHQKSLEVYSYIFETFGTEFVAGHLHEFLPGLAPVLSFASLSVRPLVYDLFQSHVVYLSTSDLRPALRSIILGLLPALEEGQGDDFDRAFAILNTLETRFAPTVEDAVTSRNSDGYFWQCLFLAVVTSPSRRQGALKYLARQLPTFGRSAGSGQEPKTRLSREAECIVAPEPGLLVRCFVCGLSDSQILVQRDFLDLMVVNLPLDSVVLQEKVVSEDLDRLVQAAIQVILRRDMSLNRRLWSWFLGPEPKEQPESSQPSSPQLTRKTSEESRSNQQLRYFTKYGKDSLERCIIKMLHSSADDVTQKSRPFRICLALMDRWEIGGLLVPKVFLPAMRSLHDYSLVTNSAASAEVIRSASGFFDGVEASLIWECLLGILREALERGRSPAQNVKLFRWIIDTFNVRDEEMLTVHIPYSMAYMASHFNSQSLSSASLLAMLDITTRLLNLIPARAFPSNPGSSQDGDTLTDSKIQRLVTDLYVNAQHLSSDQVPPLVSSVAGLLCSRISLVMASALERSDVDLYSGAVSAMGALLSKTNAGTLEDSTLCTALSNAFSSSATTSPDIPFPILASTVSLLSSLHHSEAASLMAEVDVVEIEPALTAGIWRYMSPSLPKYHVEAVKSFWQLEDLLASGETFHASVASLMRSTRKDSSISTVVRSETIQRFAVLWAHSISPAAGSGRRGSSMTVLSDSRQLARAREILEKPLLLILDALEYPDDPAFEVAKTWLAHLPSLSRVFEVILERLSGIDRAIDPNLEPAERVRQRWRHDQIRELDYHLSLVQNLLTHGTQWTWQCISNTIVAESRKSKGNALEAVVGRCMRLLSSEEHSSVQLYKRAISIMGLLLTSSAVTELQSMNLDAQLLDNLMTCIKGEMYIFQGDMLNLIHHALKLRLASAAAQDTKEHSQLVAPVTKRPSIAPPPRADSRPAVKESIVGPPPQLFTCLRAGFASPKARGCLDKWLAFLADILPAFADAIFSNLLPLVETFLGELTKCHDSLIALSTSTDSNGIAAPENVIMSLLEGLEMVLDRAYDCLMQETASEPAPKEVEPRAGFLSNVTSGVFKSEGPPSRTTTANSRLTVILAFHDSIRLTLRMWLWASDASDTSGLDQRCLATTAYNALKVRNKTRHLLQQLFSLEPLESLEVIISHWCAAPMEKEASSALSLLHVMQVSTPKSIVPAVLDALCTRTNPSVISQDRHSSLTLDIEPSKVAAFFSSYLNSIEDDAMDEVWPDCIAFLRDVLANPLPYRQVLPHLLSTILLLAEKLNNTNFGEQRKMRKDLGDIFQRLLSATFTTLPSGYVADPATDTARNGDSGSRIFALERSMTLIPVLSRVAAKLDVILDNPERMAYAVNNISQNLVSPMFHAKSYPRNITADLLELIANLSRKVPTAKSWKKEVADSFNDPRLLASSPALMREAWFAVLHQWSLHEKDRVPELLSRLAPPSSAGIMFGVGASAARLEADRKTQLNLRRICLLLLASPEDTYVAHVRAIEEKMSELFEASPASSPSSATKAELFMLCRALALSVSTFQLAPLWPIINDKLQAALNSLLPSSTTGDEFNNLTLLQACKLLDILITLSPDDFQLHEWLYISDTIDAVYQPEDWTPTALADQVAEVLGSSSMENSLTPTTSVAKSAGRRRALLGDAVDKEDIKAMPREDFVRASLRPFLSQLSIHAYEGVYSLDMPNTDALRDDLLADILDLGSIVE